MTVVVFGQRPPALFPALVLDPAGSTAVLDLPRLALLLTSPDPYLILGSPDLSLEVSMSGYTVGDKGTVLTGQCLDAGQPFDLADCTVELHIATPKKDVLTVPGELVAAAEGRWRHVWEDGELSSAGSWWVEAQVTSADGAIVQTFGPTRFDVAEQIEPT